MTLGPADRAEFTVFLLFQDPDKAATYRSALATQGYECYVFIDQEIFFDRLKEAAPHLAIFELEAIQGTLSEFVQQVLEISTSIFFLPVLDTSAAGALAPYREYNFVGLFNPGSEDEIRLVWAVDGFFSELIANRKMEQLKEESDLQIRAVDSLKEQVRELSNRPAPKAPEPVMLWKATEAVGIYSMAQNREDLVGRFLDRALILASPRGGASAIYFKYMPTLFNLVATMGRGIPPEKLKGIGVKLNTVEAEVFEDLAKKNQAPASLQDLLGQGFQVSDYFLRPLWTHRGVEGVFIFWKASELNESFLDNEWSIFTQNYLYQDLRQKYDQLNTIDPISEAHTRDFYLKTLELEVSRARRLQKPVSVIKLAVDQWDELKSKHGELVRDSILKTLVNIIKKTGRTNDFVCVSKAGELALVLPHSGRQGAAVRAERLRRIIEAQSFQFIDGMLTVSCGVSEYPTFCSSAVELDHSAGQALGYIQARGGNKLCLYKPMDKFKPDFEVPPV